MRTLLRGIAWAVGGLVLLLVVLFGALALFTHHGRPASGVTGPEADALARRIESSVDVDAWRRTGAVKWRFFVHDHLWDRRRSMARVRWGDVEVLVDLKNVDGIATRGGVRVEGEEGRKLVKSAWAYWINDSFWLNPLGKLFDDGVERSRLEVDGAPALLLRYSSGGVTPGDSYLWLLDADGRPRAWRLWTQALPLQGAEFSWEGWTQLPTGAWIAQAHHFIGLNAVKIADLTAGSNLDTIEPGPDPFGPLLSALPR